MLSRPNWNLKAVCTVCLSLFFFSCLTIAIAVAGTPPAPAKQGVQPGPECQSAFDALDKLWSTPYHMFTTQTNTAQKTPKSSESISVGGVHYVNVKGKWIKSPVDLKGMRETEQENRLVNKPSCHVVKNEAVGSDMAVVYSVHEEHADTDDPHDITKIDSTLWISKASGLVLKSEIHTVNGGLEQQLSNRFEYNNIHAPNL